MTDKKETRYKSGYRLSDAFIKRWTRILITILIAGIVLGFVLVAYTAIAYGDTDPEDLPAWIMPTMISLFSAAIGIPLVIGAVLGGLAIHRYAWIPLLLVMGGLITMGVSSVDGLGYLKVYALIAMAVGVISVFFIAMKFTNVPIWLQFPMFKSPRLYIRDDKKKKKK